MKLSVIRFIGLFIIALVVSLPVYSASVYAASISVTKNHGQAGIDGFIDGQGDVWTLEAQVTNTVGQVQPNQVKRIINGVQKEFSSCSAGDLGTMCTLQTPLPDGVNDNSIPFRVQFTAGAEQASAERTLNVDGTAPTINQFSLRQDKQKVMLTATVRDQPGVCAGLQSVELLDSSGQAVHVIQRDFSRCGDNVISEEIPRTFNGEGSELMKLRARDALGHERLSGATRFEYDFAAPQIISPTLQFEELEQNGELFLGSSRKTTSMSVEIVEKGALDISAASDSLNFRGNTKAMCQSVQKEGYENVQKCTWTNVEIDPNKQISATITAKDDKDNSATATLSRLFTPDIGAPTVSFLGVKKDSLEQKFNDIVYIKPGTVEITAEIDELGSGVKRENIFTDLTSMSRGTVNPEECGEIGAQTVCTWTVNVPSNCGGTEVCRISAWAIDNVGNEGEKKFTELHMDNVKPIVKKVEMLTTGEKRYVQTGDTMTLTIHVEEENGVRILVDVKEAVGEDAYSNGIFVFDQCEPDEKGVQVCTFDIGPVTAGYVSSVDLPMVVTDTAENEATQWPETAKNLKGTKGADYTFELLAINELVQPDFWRTGKVAPVGGENDFIDMDTTEQIPTRMAFKIPLTANTSVSARKIDLVGGCQPAEGFTFLQRNVLVSNIFAAPVSQSVTPQLILEFAPFNSREYFGVGDEATFSRGLLNMTCTLNIVSQKGNTVVTTPEIQEVNFKVPFAFTSIGSKDENLENKVKDLKDWRFKALGVGDTVSTWLGYIDYGLRILNIIVTINEIVDVASATVKVTGEAAKASVVIAGLSPVLDAACDGLQAGTVSVWKVASWIQIPTAILSCNPSGELLSNTWYGWWQKSVLQAYNTWTLRESLGIPAKGLYENIYTSTIGLCVPGIAYNMKKYHQIQCRQILCYEKEVPAGYATVEGCDRLFKLQSCEYFAGVGWQLIPGVEALNAIYTLLKNAFTSPVGIVKFALETLGCLPLCHTPDAGIALTTCKVTQVVSKAGDIVETIFFAINNRPDLTTDPFCSQIED